MGTIAPNTIGNNGGFSAYDRKKVSYDIRGAEPCISTRAVVVKQGQVLKARSLVMSDSEGKMVAFARAIEDAKTTFTGSVSAGDTVIAGGLTLTASAAMTIAEVVKAFVSGSTSKGAFSGTATYDFHANTENTILYASSKQFGTDVTNFAVTGTAVSATHLVPTTTVSAQAGGTATYAGLLTSDVDATAGDVEAQVYVSGNFWASYINWGVDVAVDTVTNADGTVVACTAYDTGAYSQLMQQKVMERGAAGCEFAIGYFNDGEVEV